jgi:hypothetical protein
MKTVIFQNVGRDKMSWTIDSDDVSPQALCSAIRKRHALLSRDIDCDNGIVYAGFRAVGTYLITDKAESLAV